MKGYIWLTSAAVVLVAMILVRLLGCDVLPGFPGCADIGPELPISGKAATENSDNAAETTIQISMASSSTKKEWLDEAVESFNTLSKSEGDFQVNGKPIEVEVVLEEGDHYRSGTMVTDILQDKIKPTIASPAEKSWILKLNRDWQALYGKPINSTDAVGLVRTPFLVAMWESRAKALGCWPTAGPECTWEQVRSAPGSGSEPWQPTPMVGECLVILSGASSSSDMDM